MSRVVGAGERSERHLSNPIHYYNKIAFADWKDDLKIATGGDGPVTIYMIGLYDLPMHNRLRVMDSD